MFAGNCRELGRCREGAGSLLLAALANMVRCISKYLECMKKTSLANSALRSPLYFYFCPMSSGEIHIVHEKYVDKNQS